MVNDSKSAFTLAEVLITLVIIGVVAALTIPTAINKYREQELKSQFRKTYSVITQALRKTEMNDFFGYAKCYYPHLYGSAAINECESFHDAFFKKFSVAKICHGNALSDGCIPNYQQYTMVSACSSFSYNSIADRDVYVLADGQIFILLPNFPIYMVDINGHKGPNTMGKDLFVFFITKNSDSGIYIDGPTHRCNATDLGAGARTTEEMMKYALADIK